MVVANYKSDCMRLNAEDFLSKTNDVAENRNGEDISNLEWPNPD